MVANPTQRRQGRLGCSSPSTPDTRWPALRRKGAASDSNAQPGKGNEEENDRPSDRTHQHSQNPEIPTFLELEITQFCQLKCAHCYSESGPDAGRGTITPDDWERLMDQAAEIGVETVQFIGGEPTLDPDFARLARYALGVGLKVDVRTNLVHVAAERGSCSTPGGIGRVLLVLRRRRQARRGHRQPDEPRPDARERHGGRQARNPDGWPPLSRSSKDRTSTPRKMSCGRSV